MNPDTSLRYRLSSKTVSEVDPKYNLAGDRPLSGGREARFSTDPKTTNLNTVVSIPFQGVLEDVILAEDSLAKSSSLSTPQPSSVYSMSPRRR